MITEDRYDSIALIAPPASKGRAASAPKQRAKVGKAHGWRIADAGGEIVAEGLASRGEAIRLLGKFASGHSLPLTVIDQSGKPTGDRLG